ncbi:N-acyl-D-amino-acid deacylase family protein [Nitrospirillum sp. BR 11828]|uniref:N-acyl-D-amino-acid deacylase family protein n=1 Tax=Nitrospirillum sp. BR 11828 TaxID=3104325 RepID=UPI002AC9F648|nr:amidohydrolase family protein [Nitrospirillum sp. BR 11828]MDZ5649746.1 amidohydrolase family protein [Nitrospirillum sp. BR 11828]
MSDYDLVIRGGTVADGTGANLWDGDIAITGGRIAATGTVTGKGREEIDARGKLVTPGFVDIHTHYDAQVTWDTRFSPSTNHGVTTVLLGNCGVGFAPCRPEQRAQMIDVMEGVEDIPGIVMAEGLPWNWVSFPDYLDAIERRPMDADFAVAIPHIPVRVFVMGQRAIDREPATSADMQAMAALVRDGLEAGAFGFSTTRVIGHRTASGDQLPVTTASEDELMTIAMAMKAHGKSLFMSASEFDTGNGFSSEFRMLARIAATSGQTVTFPLLQYNEAPERWREIADACAIERARGADIYGQVVGRPVGVLYGLQLTLHPFRGCPTYERIDPLPVAQRAAEMRRPDVRAAILAEMTLPLDPRKYPAFMRDISLCYAMGADPDYAPPESERFDNVARRRGCTVEEVAYDALLAEDGLGILYFPARNYTYCNLETVHDMLGREGAVLGLGDGGAHVGAICDGSMQTFMLSYWTRDRRGDRLSIPQAVHLMTGRTAAIGGFGDRGVIAPHFKGDLNIIDYDRLALYPPRASFDLPAGGRRLTQAARGYAATIVSGVVTARDDQPTGPLPGRLVRGRRGTPSIP